MPSVITFIITILLTSISCAEEINWTYQAEESEDATSTHYYLYASGGETITQVRWIWNGGAHNPPEVTDYILDGGNITFRHSTGQRRDLVELLNGKNVKLDVKTEYLIQLRDDAHMLVPPKSHETLTKEHRVDLANLISLLAKERKPFKPTK